MLTLPTIGSLQQLEGVPDDIKDVYRTVWDMDPGALVDMAIDRAPFIDQSQSLTLAVRRPTPGVLVRRSNLVSCFIRSSAEQKALMLRAWRGGLKTGLYYLRTLHPAFLESLGGEESASLPSPAADCCT